MLKIYRVLFILLMLLVLTLSLLPLDEGFVTTGWDKTNHLLAFITLVAMMDLAYPQLPYWRAKVLFLVFFGLLIEFLQGFTSYRFFSWLDLLADSIALVIFYPVRPLLNQCVQRIERSFL